MRRLKRNRSLAGFVAVAVLVPSVVLATHTFSDVPDGTYYTAAVEWAADNGITTGTSATTFSPDDPVTRAQNVTFAKRYDDLVVQPALDDINTAIDAITDTLGELSCGATQVVIDDGGWRCADPVLQRTLTGVTTHTVVEGGAHSVGYYPSIAIGPDGNPVIAHRNDDTERLNLYRCHDAECHLGTNIELSTLDTAGYGNSLAIGPDGNPIIAHSDGAGDDLEVYVCDQADCSSGANYELQNCCWTAYYSLAIGTDGNPIIAYQGIVGSQLWLHVCDVPDCSSGTGAHEVLVNVGDAGDGISLAIGVDGNPVIAHHDEASDDLEFYVCSAADCSSGSNGTLDSAGDVGAAPSMVIGADGNPVIAYIAEGSDRLKVYVCSSTNCSAGVDRELVDVGSFGGWEPSIAIGADGNPVIAYMHYDDVTTDFTVRVYLCADAGCTNGTSLTLSDGIFPTLVIGSDGNPVVASQRQNSDLSVAVVRYSVTGIGFE